MEDLLSTVSVALLRLASQAFWATCVGIFTLIIWYLYWKTTRDKILVDKIPGFRDWPIVGDVLHRPSKRSELVGWLMKLANERRDQKLIKLKVLEIPRLMIFSGDVVEKLTGSSKANIDKSPEYSVVHRWLGFGLLTSSGAKWKSRRRILTPSFHFSILRQFLLLINSHARELVVKLREDECDSDECFDIYKVLALSTLDIICDTAMGINVDALHGGESEYVNAIMSIKEETGTRARNPLYLNDWIYSWTAAGKKVNKAIDIAHQFAFKVIKERREAKESLGSAEEVQMKHKPFLDLLLECRDEEGKPLTDSDIREEVDTFMFEGHDTTSTALGYTIHLLGVHKEAQRRCQEEITNINESAGQDWSAADLSKMTYLECCIKESLRLFPTVPFFGRVLSEDTELGGYLVPKGVSVNVFTMGLHRDPKSFPDPEKFDPDRFLPENCVKRHPYAYVPFSAGPRNCIGQKFAMMELKVVLASLLYNFNVESVQATEELDLRQMLVLHAINGIRVKLTSRV